MLLLKPSKHREFLMYNSSEFDVRTTSDDVKNSISWAQAPDIKPTLMIYDYVDISMSFETSNKNKNVIAFAIYPSP